MALARFLQGDAIQVTHSPHETLGDGGTTPGVKRRGLCNVGGQVLNCQAQRPENVN